MKPTQNCLWNPENWTFHCVCQSFEPLSLRTIWVRLMHVTKSCRHMSIEKILLRLTVCFTRKAERTMGRICCCDKPAEADLLWEKLAEADLLLEKNIVSCLISQADKFKRTGWVPSFGEFPGALLSWTAYYSLTERGEREETYCQIILGYEVKPTVQLLVFTVLLTMNLTKHRTNSENMQLHGCLKKQPEQAGLR